MKKKSKNFIYYGLGFPVILSNFPMKTYWGEEMADINYNTLKKIVLDLLSRKPFPLTGNEIRFVRQYFGMNYTQFGERFGQTRQAVTKWENKGDDFASITPSMELHIRLAILDILDVEDKAFKEAYNLLDLNKDLRKKKHSQEPEPISIPYFAFENKVESLTQQSHS